MFIAFNINALRGTNLYLVFVKTKILVLLKTIRLIRIVLEGKTYYHIIFTVCICKCVTVISDQNK